MGSVAKSIGVKLTNQTNGGEGSSGFKQSLETIKKKTEALKGKKRGEYKTNGYHHSDETKEKIRIKNLGQKRSDEAKANMSKAHIGKKHPVSTKNKMAESHKEWWGALSEEDRIAHCKKLKAGFTSEVRHKLSVKQTKLQNTPERKELSRIYALRRWQKENS